MKRRAMVGLLGSAFLSGCGELVRNPSPPQTPTTSTPARRTTTWTRTTARVAPLPEREYSLGESYEWNNWNITVATLSLAETVRDEYETTTHELPEDEQLVVARVRLNNVGWDSQWAAGHLVIIVDGTEIYEPQYRIEFPEEEKHISVLPEVDHAQQFWTSGYSVDADETGTVWLVSIVPREVARADIEIGLESPGATDQYPVRWSADQSTAEP